MNDKVIGIFSDVHSNIDTLEKMFAIESDVTTWICAGDSVGLFPCVNETLDLMRENNVISVLGDHEESILSGEDLKHSFSGNQSLRIQETIITKQNRSYIESLQLKLEARIFSHHFLILHDLNENSGEKYLFDFEKISARLNSKVDFVIFGNTHIPSYYKGRTTTFINPGSLGFPIQAKGKPSYSLLNLVDRTIQFKIVETQQRKVRSSLLESDYNPKFMKYIEDGYSWTSQ